MQEFQKGEIVFNEHGQRFIFVTEADGDYIVRPMMETDDEEPWEGSPVTLRRVFASAPREIYDKTIESLDAKIAKLEEQKRALEEEIRKSKYDETERKKRIMVNAALKRIDDFLAGKITHIVYGEYGVEIKTFEEATQDPDHRSRDIKLLSLFGRSGGDLAWKLNDYYDGSGSWRHVYPCASLDDATAIARHLIETKYEEWRKDKTKSYWMASVISAAIKFGVPIPEDVYAAVKDARIKTAADHLEGKKKELSEAESMFHDATNRTLEELLKGEK